MVVDDRCEIESHVVLCHAHLSGDLDDLDPHVDLDEPLGKRVDLDKTGIDCAIESAELCNEPDIALANRLVRIWTYDATRYCAAEAYKRTQVVDWQKGASGQRSVRGGGWSSLLIDPYQPGTSASLSPSSVCA